MSESRKPFSTAELIKLRQNGAGRSVPHAQRLATVYAVAEFSRGESWKGWSPRELKRARKLAREIARRQINDGEAAA